MTCPNCGRNIASDSNFCEFCGAKIPKSNNRKALLITLVAILVVSFMAIVSYRAYVVHEKAVAEARAAQEEAERQVAEAQRLAEEARLAQEEAERMAKEAAIEAARLDSIQKVTDKRRRAREAEEENKRRMIEAEKRAEEEAFQRRIKPYLEQGYVNLGLPSRTLWKSYDEERIPELESKNFENYSDGCYSYSYAMQLYGNKIPSKRQWEELKSHCSWSYDEDNKCYIVRGPNNNIIILPHKSGVITQKGENYVAHFKLECSDCKGNYWSKTSNGSHVWLMTYHKKGAHVIREVKEEEISSIMYPVRLIINP